MNSPVTRREALLGTLGVLAGIFLTSAGDQWLSPKPASPVSRVRSGSPAIRPSGSVTETEVYASPLTLKNFPIISEIPDWTRGRIKAIFVISPEDFDGPACRKAIQITKSMHQRKTSLSEAQRLVDQPQIISNIRAEVVETLNHLIGAERLLRIDEDTINTLCDMAINGSAWTKTTHLDAASLDDRMAIITTPYADASKEMMAAEGAGIHFKDLENVEGTNDEARAMAIMHEVEHASYNGCNSIGGEIRADIGAADFYALELKKGNVKTPNLPDFWQRMRAIGSIINKEPIHATNAAIRSGDEGNPPITSDKIFIEQINLLRQLVCERITWTVPLPNSLPALANILENKPSYEGAEKIPLTIEEEKILKKIVQLILEGNVAEMYKQIEFLSPFVNLKIRTLFEHEAQLIAKTMMEHDHPLLYTTIADMQREGAFNEHPIANQYACEFLQAAKRHASKHFKTESYGNNNFIPPAFDENGQPAIQHLGVGGPG